MSLWKLYEELAVKNIRIWKDGDKLKFKAPAGAFSDDLKALVQDNKSAILQDLKEGIPRFSALSLNQQALWFLQKMNPRSDSYNVILAFSITEDCNERKITEVLKGLIQVHPMLSAIFPASASGTPYTRIRQNCEVPFSRIRTSGSASWEKSSEVAEFCRLPFNLQRDLPLRTALFTSEATESLIVLVFHHIVCDAISLDTFLADFFRLYSGRDLVQDAQNSSWTTYHDFIDEQLRYLTNEGERERHKKLWKEILAGTKDVVEYSHSGSTEQEEVGDNFGLLLESETRTALETIARNLGITKTAIVLSAFELSLHQLLNLNNYNLGVLTSGRAKSKYRHAPGYYVNPVLFQVNEDFTRGRNEILSGVNERFQIVVDQTEYPFSLVVEDVQASRVYGRNPLFQIAFNYISRQATTHLADFVIPGERIISIDGLEVQPCYISQQKGQFDMTFEIIEGSEADFWNIKYKRNLFPEELIRQLVETVRETALSFGSEIFTEPIGSQYVTDIVFVSNFTADPVKEPCSRWLGMADMLSRVEMAPYNQVFQELLDPVSRCNANRNGFNVVLLRLEDWLAGYKPNEGSPSEESLSRIEEIMEEFSRTCSHYLADSHSPLFVYFLPSSRELISNGTVSDFFGRKEMEFRDAFKGRIQTVLSNFLLEQYPHEVIDPVSMRTAHIPYTMDFFNFLGMCAARDIWGYQRKPCKVIVLDCDNTLWKGIVGEDGVEGVQITSEYRELQEQLVRLESKGILLCLNSKNNEDDVLRVFTAREEMILSLENITLLRVNWKNKSENILSIADELNLNPDSFLFIDDNPVECAEVKAAIPEVFVLNFTDKESNRASILENLWPLNMRGNMDSGYSRTIFYKSNVERKKVESSSASLQDFLAGLGLKVEIREMAREDIARVSELSLRVNQFNFTGITFSEADLYDYLTSRSCAGFIISASDKFGDYGMVGAVLLETLENRIVVKNLMLSCRALGKGIEKKLYTFLGGYAEKYGCSEVYFSLINTGRNKPAFLSVEYYFATYRNETESPGFTVPPFFLTGELADFKSEETEAGNTVVKRESREHSDTVLDEKLFIHIAREAAALSDIKENRLETVSEGEDAAVASIWSRVLQNPVQNYNANFFELGGTSLMIPLILSLLEKEQQVSLEVVDLFKYPTVHTLAQHCRDKAGKNRVRHIDDNLIDDSMDIRTKRLSVQNRFRRVRGK